jgi:hypothetical protein
MEVRFWRIGRGPRASPIAFDLASQRLNIKRAKNPIMALRKRYGLPKIPYL